MTVAATTAASSTTGSATNASLLSGQQNLATSYTSFLTLLTAQLKNQDPTSPLDTNQFTQQLVQLTGGAAAAAVQRAVAEDLRQLRGRVRRRRLRRRADRQDGLGRQFDRRALERQGQLGLCAGRGRDHLHRHDQGRAGRGEVDRAPCPTSRAASTPSRGTASPARAWRSPRATTPCRSPPPTPRARTSPPPCSSRGWSARSRATRTASN